MFYFAMHSIAVVSWAIFLLQFIKSFEFENSDTYIFSILSLFFLVLVFYLGIKLITFNPLILKSGGWLHLKITLALLLGIENIFFAIKFYKRKTISKKVLEISYWLSYVTFMLILFLTFVRPF